VEPAFAFVADRPWTMAFPFAVMAIFITWMSVYAGKQRVTASGFARRYLTAVLAWSLLHVAYTLLVAAAGFRSVPFILAGAVVVAAPLFAGAYIEARRA
jgi:hypothetical protein